MPGIRREFCPLTLNRTVSGHHDDTVCLDWSDDSQNLMMGSKDLSVRVYHNVHTKKMSMTVLSGHRDRLVGAFFSSDGKSAYTVARDGAIFSWSYEVLSVVVTVENKGISHKSKKYNDNNDDGEDDEEDVERSDDENEDVQNKNEQDNDNDNHVAAEESALALVIKKSKKTIIKEKGIWKLTSREFLWEPHTQVTSVAYNKSSSLLVVGFDKGVFGLYEMPGCVNIHKLSVSHHSLNTACINNTGEWLALGSTRLGQLLVWEWQSETYVLKQQGHLYGISTLDFSSDGQYIATGGDDSKVKLWNASSGFCFVTFSEHVAPVTGDQKKNNLTTLCSLIFIVVEWINFPIWKLPM